MTTCLGERVQHGFTITPVFELVLHVVSYYITSMNDSNQNCTIKLCSSPPALHPSTGTAFSPTLPVARPYSTSTAITTLISSVHIDTDILSSFFDNSSDKSKPRSLAPRNPDDMASEPHINGHLVYTGWSFRTIPDNRLFIHTADQCLGRSRCRIFAYNAGHQNINSWTGPSPQITIMEHGWFTDVAMFQQIATNFPQTPGQNFINWRDNLLLFLNTSHGGAGGRWTPIT